VIYVSFRLYTTLGRGVGMSSPEDQPLPLAAQIAKLVNEDAKTPGGVAEASGRYGGGDPLDEEGPEGFILPVGGVGGFQEPAGQC
jgi:hypothetical protein